jgi:hypothetical protein
LVLVDLNKFDNLVSLGSSNISPKIKTLTGLSLFLRKTNFSLPHVTWALVVTHNKDQAALKQLNCLFWAMQPYYMVTLTLQI